MENMKYFKVNTLGKLDEFLKYDEISKDVSLFLSAKELGEVLR